MKKQPVYIYGQEKGKWAGKVNQQVAQVKTNLVFKKGDIHPKYPKLRFLSYRNEKRSRLIFPNGKKIPKNHHRYLAPTTIKTQRWTTVEDFKQIVANEKQKQRIKRGYYEKDRAKARKNRLNQKSLQVKDTGFKTYDPHPFAKGVIFQSYRHKQGGFQRWMRGDESNRGHQSKARILSESLQTNKPIGYWHRGNPHPQNKKYVFSQYTSHDPRSNCESVLVNGYFYRKYNPEQWMKIGTKWCPSIVSRKKSLNKKINSQLQTNQPKNTFKRNDVHPNNTEYLFAGYRPSNTTPEHWVHKNSKTAKCIATKNITKIPQSKLKTGLPKGTFKRGQPHPTKPNLIYDKWNSKYNQERWFTPEDHIKYIENHKAYYEIPENKKRKDLIERAHRSTEEYKQKQRIKRAIRYATDPQFVLRKLISGRIRNALRNFKANKYFSSQELVGCTLLKLRQHLESQFTTGMSWQNQGAWHIDHIIPCANFELTDPEEQKKCFHYTNLQPLWAHDNLSKGSKLNWQKAA